MATLAEHVSRQLIALQGERDRIQQQAVRDVAAVDEKLDALKAAARVLTRDVEASYATLVQMGLIQAVTSDRR